MRGALFASSVLLSGLVVCLCLALFSLTALPRSAAAQGKELLIGIEPQHNIFDQMERYRHLAAYLSGQTGVKVNLTIMSRYGQVTERMKSRKLDGAFLSSYSATLGIRELNLDPVVNPVNLGGESTSRGYLFIRKDSGIRNVRDMRGKSIVFVDQASMEGYLFLLPYLKGQGVSDFSKHFNRFHFSGSHASAIYTVLDGRADVGVAKNTVFNELVHKDPSILQELDIIAQSPQVPEITFCMTEESSKDMQTRLAAVFLGMDKTAEGRKVLGRFKAQRFVKANRKDFVRIEEMAQEVPAAKAGDGAGR